MHFNRNWLIQEFLLKLRRLCMERQVLAKKGFKPTYTKRCLAAKDAFLFKVCVEKGDNVFFMIPSGAAVWISLNKLLLIKMAITYI